MPHVLALTYLVIILVGAWAVFALLQAYRTRGVPLLRRFLDYIVFYNAMVLGFLLEIYVFTNLVGGDPSSLSNSLFAVTEAPLFAIHIGLSWTLLRLAWALRGRAFPLRLTRVLVVVAVLAGVVYGVGTTILIYSGAKDWLLTMHSVLGVLTAVVVITVALALIAGRPGGPVNTRRKSARSLGWYWLCGYLVAAGSLALPELAKMVLWAVSLLWLNCVPLIWLHREFPLHHQVSVKEEEAAVATLAQQHGITQRELEIMQLLVLGKSYKEIEEQLGISYSTVKNHAYNIYGKLDVSGRAQLTHMVLTSKPLPGAADPNANGKG